MINPIFAALNRRTCAVLDVTYGFMTQPMLDGGRDAVYLLRQCVAMRQRPDEPDLKE